MNKRLKQVETARDAWQHEHKMKTREMDALGHHSTSSLLSLEREKRALVEKNRYLEERLETECMRAKGAEHEKDIAMATSDGMRKHFDFYRNYYEAQEGLYGQYFGIGENSRSSSPKDKKVDDMEAITESKENEGRDGAVSMFAAEYSSTITLITNFLLQSRPPTS